MTTANTGSNVLRNGIFAAIVLLLIGIAGYFYGHNPRKPTQMSHSASSGTISVPPAERSDAPLTSIQLSPQRLQSIGVKFGTVDFKDVSEDIRVTGTVEADERRISYVQPRFSGWIRTVFVNATYDYVRKGQPLFTIYSPELVATERELLVAQQNQKALQGSSIEGVSSGAASLSAAAEARLEQWQVTASEIAKLKQTGKEITDLVVQSPASGYVTEKNVLPNMYVQPETKLYTITDLSTVWINAEIFQGDVGKLKHGDLASVMVDAYPGQTFTGHVQEVLPLVQAATRTVRVRIAMPNPGLKLKPGMFVGVNLRPRLGRQLVVSASAVVNSGTRQMVFINRGEGNLEPREIQVGARAGDDYIVLKGLSAKESVVTSANFLIDSESQLQAAAGAFAPPPGAGGAGGVAAVSIGSNATELKVEFTTEPPVPHKGNNTMRVRVSDAHGSPVTGAQVIVTNFMAAMPAMGMAAITSKTTLAEKGVGRYEGVGQLETGGTWQFTINVSKAGQLLSSKRLTITAEGGM